LKLWAWPCNRRAHAARCQIGIVGDDHKDVDIFRIRLGRHNRAQHGNSRDTSSLSDIHNESAQRVEQSVTVPLGSTVHHRYVLLSP
jgi:hypothetical protein